VANLKKQSQCLNGQNGTMSVLIRSYRSFAAFWWFLSGEKQSQLYSFIVLRAACRGMEFEKTKPILRGINWRKDLFERRLWKYFALRGREKTNPI
jgi:hypothetical protein